MEMWEEGIGGTQTLVDYKNGQHDIRPQTDLDLPDKEPKDEGPVVRVSISDALRNKHERIIRRRYAKTSIREYLEQISDEELRKKYLEFYDGHIYFQQVCAGAKHHHHWVGGLVDHCREMIGVMLDIKDLYRGDFEGKISKDEVVISVLLHDFSKIWSYELLTDDDRERNPHKYLEAQSFKYSYGHFNIVDEYSKLLLELGKYGIVPSEKIWSAVLFHEGGYSDHNFTYGGTSKTGDTVMSHNPLAVILHIGDMYSSQILGGSIA